MTLGPPGTTCKPATGLFPRLRSRDDLERLRLRDDQVRSFGENGYLAGIRVLEGATLDAVREAVERIQRGESPRLETLYEVEEDYYRDPEANAFHCLGGWLVEPALHDLIFHPAATVPAAQLLGLERLRFWHDQVFYKPPRHPGVVSWHQDFSYWTRTLPMRHITMNIVLDDTSLGNGCLHYVPGSHRWPDLPVTGLAGDMDSIQSVLTDEQKSLFKPVAVELKAGECSFHHPRMIHGSFANVTDRPRRATVINVFRDGVRSASDAPPLRGVPAIPRGEPMGGRFFPLLFEPSHPRLQHPRGFRSRLRS